MAGRDGTGEKFAPGSRKRDRTVDDALRTMERLATWLDMAEQENVWLQAEDPLQVGMLHGLLHHLHQKIERLLLLGGEELQDTVLALQTLAAQEER
jgi:hypothetical protein